MVNITISNLQPIGSALFADSESYLNQLSEEELRFRGGLMNTVFSPATVTFIFLMR